MRDARLTEIKFRGYRPNVGLNFSYANKNYSKVLNESHIVWFILENYFEWPSCQK